MLQHSRTSDISYKYFENKRIEDVQLINRREKRERRDRKCVHERENKKERRREEVRKRKREDRQLRASKWLPLWQQLGRCYYKGLIRIKKKRERKAENNISGKCIKIQ